jgi:hypothetical protein
MPFYNDLRPNSDNKKLEFGFIFPEFTDSDKNRTIEVLLPLRSSLYSFVPQKTSDKSLLLASWNIKEFVSVASKILSYLLTFGYLRFDRTSNE